ncbi:MAG: DUF1146 domain-containing protein [Acholeplasmatales bacterium]|nr:DUF1146 domain-containing protein [Acholeplasmatales bacterium]
MVYNIVYILVWCAVAFLYYIVLRNIKIERLFAQGKVREIRLCYVLLIFVLSYLTTKGLFTLVDIIIPTKM